MLRTLEQLWFIGDKFVHRSFTSNFKHAKTLVGEPNFCTTNFDVIDSSTTKFIMSVHNVLARQKALLAKTITDEKYLPKTIVFIPDNNIIKQLSNFMKDELQTIYFHMMSYLFEEINRMVVAYKEKLPTKSRKEHFPHIIWIAPPTHKYFNNNRERATFTSVIMELSEKYQNFCTLELKKVWDPNMAELFLAEQRHFTDTDLTYYWAGVDAAMRFWNKTLSDILVKKSKKEGQKSVNVYHETLKTTSAAKENRKYVQGHGHDHYFNRRRSEPNQYIWHSNRHHHSHRRSHESFQHGRKLPPPSQKHY